MPRRQRPPPSAFPQTLASRLLVLSSLCFPTRAQPSEREFLARNLGSGNIPVGCPAGYYKASSIIWGCAGALGRRVFSVEPQTTVVATKLPMGLQNLSMQVITASHIDTQLEDAATKAFILTDGNVTPGFGPPNGPVQYKRSPHDQEHILVGGVLKRDLLLKVINLEESMGVVQLDYRFDGFSPCSKVPSGCHTFDKGAAVREVKAWSDWVQEKYGSVDAAWKALFLVAEGVGSPSRRLAAVDSIPWLGWMKVWGKWDGASSKSSWQQTFHLLDVDADQAISKEEFATGYNGELEEAAGSGSGSGFPWWIFILLMVVVPPLVCAYYLWKHPAMLEQARSKLPQSVPSNLLEKVGLEKKDLNDDAEKTMILKTEDTTEPEADSSLLGSYNRQKFCSIMSCVWGRDEKTPRALPLEPSGDADKVEAIVEQMRAAKGDVALQEGSLQKLEELALDPELKKRIGNCEGPESVIEAMYAHPNSAVVQEHACAVLGNQASSNEDQQKALAERGAVRAVIKAMHEHSSNFRVQETATWALRELALVDVGRKEITDCGGIERVLLAMRTHPAAVAVLEHGCMALAYLSYDPDLRRWIAYDGGVNTIVKAMQSQPDDSVVQEAGCLALRNLSCSQEPQQAILELSGDDVIVHAMVLHAASGSVQDTACDALSVMEPDPKKLLSIGALDAITQAMERHPENESLQAKAAKLLQHAAADAAARETIKQLGSVELLGQARAAFPDSREVQVAALDAAAAIEQG